MLKKKLALLLLFLATALQPFAQQNPAALKYASMLTPDGARKHLEILASDAFEGRETGTRGARMAAEYIAKEFNSIGLDAPVKGSYFQQVGLVQSKLEVEKFQINGEKLQHLTDIYIARASGRSKKIKADEIVFAGYGISASSYDDLKGMDIEDRVVLIWGTGEPKKDGKSLISGSLTASEWADITSKRIQNLRERRPALILMVNPELPQVLRRVAEHLASPAISLKRGESTAATYSEQAEVVQLTTRAANVFLRKSGKNLEQLQKVIEKSGAPASSLLHADFEASFGVVEKDVEGANVLGYLEGSDLKDELLVISAHYDHVGLSASGADRVFNGADDDGSGTTAVLEMARAFAQAKRDGQGPRRSILFLAVVAEEKGLLGSHWYSDFPVFPLKNTVANLNIDMIGRVDPAHQHKPDYCYLIGSDKLSTQLHQISEFANSTYTKLEIDYKYNDPNDPERIYYRSDHYNFAKHGIPIIFHFNGVHEDYHKVSDEVSKINFPLLTKRSQLVFHTAWEIVNRDERPAVDVKDDMPKVR